MKVEQNQIDELKKKHGEIYEGTVDFNDEDGKPHAVAFVFRKPKTIDVEAYAKNTQSVGAVAGNLNLLQSLIVHPEPAAIIETLREYPNAYGKFIEEAVQPFFGSAAVATKRKL
jgi:hypothetical protein